MDSSAYCDSQTLVEDFARNRHHFEIPDGFVMASASRPDWPKSDYLVFQVKYIEEIEDMSSAPTRPQSGNTFGARTTRPHSGNAFGATKSRRIFVSEWSQALSRPSTATSEEIDDGRRLIPTKEGRFFSQLQKTVGTWKIQGNVLTLIWGLSFRTDTVIASSSPRRWNNKRTEMSVHVLEPKYTNPEWFLPEVLASKFHAESIASKGFECPVCYFELFKFPVGVLRLHSRRCCGHYFHFACASHLLNSVRRSGRQSACPVCGVAFSEVKMMPDLMRDPNDWFCVVDIDLGGELDTYEVIEALGCVMPLNRHKLEKNVKAHWHEWDPDYSGSINLREFNRPDDGLKDWLLKHFSLIKSEKSQNYNNIPSIDKYPRLWFHYWDQNGDGELQKEEIVRALVRTFCIDDDGRICLARAHDLREVATGLWSVLGYTPIDHLSLEEFVKPYGLMDQFLHNQTNCMYFGADVEIEELA